ncbi:MAG: transposase [Fibrobacter sp.]|nr:transposase [Fibrobacter sp.]
MDGKGRALDNVFVERFWRIVKYEEMYIRGYSNIYECRSGLNGFFKRYNTRRKHSSLLYNFPTDVYIGKVTLPAAACFITSAAVARPPTAVTSSQIRITFGYNTVYHGGSTTNTTIN